MVRDKASLEQSGKKKIGVKAGNERKMLRVRAA